jgi:hypothetical protein
VKERRKKEKPCKDYEQKNIIVSKAIRCTVLKRKGKNYVRTEHGPSAP